MIAADVGESFAQAAASGSLLAAVPVALLAGVVSFASPCVLPLVPGYISAVAGVTPGQEREPGGTWRVLGPSLLFVLSFSTISGGVPFGA